MRRVILCCIFLLTIAMLAGCSGKDETVPVITTTPTEDTTAPASTTAPEEETTTPTSADPGTEEERTIYHEQQGKLSAESTSDTVVVYATGVKESEIFANIYLEATVQGNTLTYELGQWEYRAFREGGISLADFDGDGTDEIVLIMTVTGNGGTLAQVFSAGSGEISLLYELNDIPLNLETIYKDGFWVTIGNSAIGFSENIDVSKEFASECFDQNGKYKAEFPVYSEPIHSGHVETASSDGVPVIICERTIGLTNRLGSLISVFRHNPKTDTLEVVSLEFQKR